MKKQYIQPSVKVYNVKASAILADVSAPQLTSGGSNSNGPRSADAKGFFDDWDD